ncbi:hypothetical protein SAMN05660648_01060 [Selenomonas ruminantium]|uniref:Lipoprotein n=2 Tax=Selenomonas ruminantium TaxID=971 RepID=A0A1I0XW48_SELRU|nr:hypothetical protein [Selenomonas ruminantium]SDZ88682.1 hypothetical protein SAMN05660648_01060 [Selenomonas ruminantium]SFB05359.1 hypothetical protein SAMN05216587_10828 [Selenomonas ruminantium]
MKKSMGKFFLAMMMLAVMVASAGCMIKADSSGLKFHGGGEDVSVPADWETVSLPKNDGGQVVMKMPFALKRVADPHPNGPVKESVRYQNESDRMVIDVLHGSLDDPKDVVKYNLGTFMWAVNIAEKHPEIKSMESQKLNGQEITRAKIAMVNNKNIPFSVDCVGLNFDNEFFIIEFFYPEGDQEMKAAAEKSIATLNIK